MKAIKIQSLTLFIAAITLLSSQQALAKPTFRDMVGCQSYLNFVQIKLEDTHERYDAADIELMTKGLSSFDNHIQKSFVDPELLAFAKGDPAKAKELQVNVDLSKEKAIFGHNSRHPYKHLSMHLVQEIDKCTQKTMPTGSDLEALIASLKKMLELIQNQ